jgi:hypothetical protein
VPLTQVLDLSCAAGFGSSRTDERHEGSRNQTRDITDLGRTAVGAKANALADISAARVCGTQHNGAHPANMVRALTSFAMANSVLNITCSGAGRAMRGVHGAASGDPI